MAKKRKKKIRKRKQIKKLKRTKKLKKVKRPKKHKKVVKRKIKKRYVKIKKRDLKKLRKKLVKRKRGIKESKKLRTIESYSLKVDGVPVRISIVEDPKQFTMLYKVFVPQLKPGTAAALESVREKLVSAFKKGVVVEQGLIAHGRGECFDYILGEETQPFALNAEKAASATLMLSQNPVISVNGNSAALCARELIKLAEIIKAKIEVNLFHRSLKRLNLIKKLLKCSDAATIKSLMNHPLKVIFQRILLTFLRFFLKI